MTDRELLEQLAAKRSEDAFNEIVRRHVDLVHSAALRQLGNPDTARDITQNVFILLARQAKRLGPGVILTGWLYRTARNLCLEHIRKDQRRREREHAAASHLMNTDSDQWEHIAPELEPAMDELNEADRHAVLLRFFDNRNLRDVGAELGIGEDAAQKRVSRALDRLRNIFSKRGVTLSATALATTISSSAVSAAPTAIVTTISSAVVGAGLTAAATAATLNTASTMTALFNLKTASAVLATVAVTGTSTYLVKENQIDELRTEQSALAADHAQLLSDQQSAMALIQTRDEQVAALKKDIADLPRLRGEIDRLNRELKVMEGFQRENARLSTSVEELQQRLLTVATNATERVKLQKEVEFNTARIGHVNSLKLLALVMRIYANDHQDLYPDTWNDPQFMAILSDLEPDTYPRAEDFDPKNYEQVYFGSDANLAPNIVTIRQREPIVDPNGTRWKQYATADGAVHSVQEEQVGSFAEFERNWTQSREPIVFTR